MVGLEVSPVTAKPSMYRFNVPAVSILRLMESNQMLCPA
jgi:hypothetical protein